MKARRTLIEGLASGRIAAPSTITVADFAEEWLATRDGRVKPRTYEADARNVAILRKHFASLRLQDLGARQVEQFLAKLRSGAVTGNALAEGTVGQAFGTLRLICASAASDDLLATNPCERIQRHTRPTQKSIRQPRVLSSDQLDALVEAASKKTPAYAGVIAVLAYTGCRAREALGLRWEDVDSATKLLAFTRQIDKTGLELVDLKTPSAKRANALVPRLVAVPRSRGADAGTVVGERRLRLLGESKALPAPTGTSVGRSRQRRRRPGSGTSALTTYGTRRPRSCSSTPISPRCRVTSGTPTSPSQPASTHTRSDRPASKPPALPRPCASEASGIDRSSGWTRCWHLGKTWEHPVERCPPRNRKPRLSRVFQEWS